MNDYELKITHLCVGQGLAVLIELDYHDGNDHFVGLLDFGTSKFSSTASYEKALESVSNVLKNNSNRLNYVHISHFDYDHYSLFEKLQNKYYVNITIDRLIYGGMDKNNNIPYNFKNYLVLKRLNLGEFVADHPYRRLNEELGVSIELKPNEYFKIIPIVYHPKLIDNKFSNSVFKNSNSSIINVFLDINYIPIMSYVFTGDALKDTMKYFLGHCYGDFGDENKLIGISHHGTKIHVADDDNTNFSTLNEFLRKIRPNCAVCSAKSSGNRGWAHPDIETIKVYIEYLLQIPDFKQDLTALTWENNSMKVKKMSTDRPYYATFRLDPQYVVDGAPYNNFVDKEYNEYLDICYKYNSKTNTINLDEL